MNADLASYYARRARDYERVYDKPERQPALRALHERCRAFFAGRNVLEVSCGTGYWTSTIAGSARTIVGTDINDEVLAIARGKAWPAGTVAFQRADAYALPMFSQPFDAGFAGFWWSHVPRRQLRAFLEGFHAALTTGARVMFIDNRYVEGSNTPIHRTDKHGDTFQRRTLADGSVHDVLKNFPTEDDLRRTVAALADDVEIALLDYFWVLTYRTKRDPHRRKRTQFWGEHADDDRLIREILAGHKTATVCKADEHHVAMNAFDDGGMAPGDVVDVYDLRGRLRCVIRVTEVYPLTFSAIPEKLWRGENCTSAEHFRDVHRACWPQYRLDDDFELMATHFELVREA